MIWARSNKRATPTITAGSYEVMMPNKITNDVEKTIIGEILLLSRVSLNYVSKREATAFELSVVL